MFISVIIIVIIIMIVLRKHTLGGGKRFAVPLVFLQCKILRLLDALALKRLRVQYAYIYIYMYTATRGTSAHFGNSYEITGVGCTGIQRTCSPV